MLLTLTLLELLSLELLLLLEGELGVGGTSPPALELEVGASLLLVSPAGADVLTVVPSPPVSPGNCGTLLLVLSLSLPPVELLVLLLTPLSP